MHEPILMGPFHFYLNIWIKEKKATFTAHQAQCSLHLLHWSTVYKVPGAAALQERLNKACFTQSLWCRSLRGDRPRGPSGKFSRSCCHQFQEPKVLWRKSIWKLKGNVHCCRKPHQVPHKTKLCLKQHAQGCGVTLWSPCARLAEAEGDWLASGNNPPKVTI